MSFFQAVKLCEIGIVSAGREFQQLQSGHRSRRSSRTQPRPCVLHPCGATAESAPPLHSRARWLRSCRQICERPTWKSLLPTKLKKDFSLRVSKKLSQPTGLALDLLEIHVVGALCDRVTDAGKLTGSCDTVENVRCSTELCLIWLLPLAVFGLTTNGEPRPCLGKCFFPTDPFERTQI